MRRRDTYAVEEGANGIDSRRFLSYPNVRNKSKSYYTRKGERYENESSVFGYEHSCSRCKHSGFDRMHRKEIVDGEAVKGETDDFGSAKDE